MIILFQIIFTLFSLFAIANVIKRQREGFLSTRGMWFWILFWVVAAGAVVWPKSTQMLADDFGIGRGTDLVVYVSVAAMFFLLFKLHVKIEGISREVTSVVRKEALEKKQKSKI